MSHIWHPYTQHKLSPEPLKAVSAKNEFIYLEDGREIVDAISSWWVNPYGHANEFIAGLIHSQILQLDQVIFAGFTHDPALQVSEQLLKLLPPNQDKVFFSDNGSTAVEVALKMAIQYFFNKKEKRKKIIAFEGAYHGDTFGAMAAGARGKFFEPFEDFVFDVIHIPAPTPGKEEDSLSALKSHPGSDVCAFIFEPLVQGAAGMVMHSPDALDRLISYARSQGIICIADEVMTGFGRTGRNFACDHLNEQPDIMCLSKGLTAGVLPMSVTTCSASIWDAFYSDDRSHTLFHGHSYTGNPVGCAAALGSLQLLRSEDIQQAVRRITAKHSAFVQLMSDKKCFSRIQQQGTILALEISTGEGNDYFSSIRDQMYGFFLERNVLLRPLGNVIYILPPYCISNNSLDRIYAAIADFVEDL